MKITFESNDNTLPMRSPSDNLSICGATHADIADVLLYLIRISDKLGIDLSAAAKAKIELNAAKYPVNKARGSSKKYTEL